MKKNYRQEIYKSPKTVFNMREIGILTGERNADNLKSKVNYYVSKGVIRAVRRGIYVKDPYSSEELACRIYSPSYISLESVLQRAGVVFQYSSVVTAVSYLSRSLTVDGHNLEYRKIKNNVLVNNKGIEREGNVSVAIPERAFLDRLYLSKDYYFDNIAVLDWGIIEGLLDMYDCAALIARAGRLFKHV
jgi:hypothetical protein